MTHRYNTRSKSKQQEVATKSNKPANSPVSFDREMLLSMTAIFPMKATVPNTSAHTCTSGCEEREKELKVVKSLIEMGTISDISRREKIMYTIKLFHYFENHQHLLRNFYEFRQTTINKIMEFRKVKEEDENELKNMHWCTCCNTNYINHIKLLGMLEVLIESCDRVYQIIQNF